MNLWLRKDVPIGILWIYENEEKEDQMVVK
jgi:hypothetical protein